MYLSKNLRILNTTFEESDGLGLGIYLPRNSLDSPAYLFLDMILQNPDWSLQLILILSF